MGERTGARLHRLAREHARVFLHELLRLLLAQPLDEQRCRREQGRAGSAEVVAPGAPTDPERPPRAKGGPQSAAADPPQARMGPPSYRTGRRTQRVPPGGCGRGAPYVPLIFVGELSCGRMTAVFLESISCATFSDG